LIVNLGSTTDNLKKLSKFSVNMFERVSRLISNNLEIKIYKTILSVVLYGWKAWSLRLGEKYLGSRVLRMGSGEGSNEELHSSYRSPDMVRMIKSRRLRRACRVVRMEEGRTAFKILSRTPTS
jgi:hypothetical protein